MAPDAGRLTDAVGRAVAFLKERLVSGDYGLQTLQPDGSVRYYQRGHVFAGHFIADALAEDVSELDRTMLLTRILSEERNGLWGYSLPPLHPGYRPIDEVYFVDADDTAFVLRTLRRLAAFRSPERLLVFYRRWGGSFGTYRKRGPNRLVADSEAGENFAVHPEVNANVFRMLQGTRLDRYINDRVVLQSQSPEGYWPSYFYPSRYYATRLFLEVISERPALEKAGRKGVEFLLASQNADGSWGDPGDPYETALATGGLAAASESGESFTRGVNYLLETMASAGSWGTAKRIWTFRRDGKLWGTCYDAGGIVVTSLAAMTLRHALRALS